MQLKPKKCKACKARFSPAMPMQSVCGVLCAQSVARKKREADEKKTTRARREKLKSRKDWEKEAQTAFNAWIRARDADLPCISCGRHHGGQWHAGHYLSTGARPELRFEPDNVHKQCQPCNTHLSGNLVFYRLGLIARIGLERVEALQGPHPQAKRTIEDLKEIRDRYRKLVAGLKA